jgi:Family of unknown function (DUF5681)
LVDRIRKWPNSANRRPAIVEIVCAPKATWNNSLGLHSKMTWKKGQTGNPHGQIADKPFREALRMEIAAADGDQKALRRIAARLIKQAEAGDLQATSMIADRLDGKAAQETTVNVVKRDAEDWTRAELVAIIRRSEASEQGIAAPDGRGGGSDKIH